MLWPGAVAWGRIAILLSLLHCFTDFNNLLFSLYFSYLFAFIDFFICNTCGANLTIPISLVLSHFNAFSMHASTFRPQLPALWLSDCNDFYFIQNLLAHSTYAALIFTIFTTSLSSDFYFFVAPSLYFSVSPSYNPIILGQICSFFVIVTTQFYHY